MVPNPTLISSFWLPPFISRPVNWIRLSSCSMTYSKPISPVLSRAKSRSTWLFTGEVPKQGNHKNMALPDELYDQIESQSERGNDCSDDSDFAWGSAPWHQRRPLLTHHQQKWEK